jgi:protein involved in polysaccharide export with SLBB domain
MRSIGIFLLFLFATGVYAAPTSQRSLATTNSAIIPAKPSIVVSGQVQKPGRYDWVPGMTVVDAIAVAGGLKQSAGHRIRISHDDGSLIIFHSDTFPYGVKKPPLLKAGDSVSIPSERTAALKPESN